MHHTFFPFGYSFVVVEACWGKHAREAKATWRDATKQTQ